MKYYSVNQYLIKMGLISEDSLRERLKEYRQLDNPPCGFREYLMLRTSLGESELVKAYMDVSDVAFIDLSNKNITKEVSGLIPANICRSYGFMPCEVEKGVLSVAFKDPTDLIAIEKASYYSRCKIKKYVSYISTINRTISNIYGTENADAAIELMQQDVEPVKEDAVETEEDSATIKFVDSILQRAIAEKASDIHIEPSEAFTTIRIRVDGLLRDIQKAPAALHSSVIARIKVMGNMDVAERRIPQDGRSHVVYESEKIDLRISSIPAVFGEKVVIRLLRKSAALLDKSAIGLRGENIDRYESILRNHHGVILMVGPTGSGKSTTMATMIKVLNKREVNIITLEDPVEYNIEGISQIQINEKTGMTFAKGLRAAMRQDPDIICVGEIRDAETAEIAMRAAITGHLVISTLHTNDAISTFERLKDMGVPSYLIASSIIGIISQRLVRKCCEGCGGEGRNHDGNRLAKCPVCMGTGYNGRTGVFEILPMNNELRTLIANEMARDKVEEAANKTGYFKLKDACEELIQAGITNREETNRILNEE